MYFWIVGESNISFFHITEAILQGRPLLPLLFLFFFERTSRKKPFTTITSPFPLMGDLCFADINQMADTNRQCEGICNGDQLFEDHFKINQFVCIKQLGVKLYINLPP